jgi:hypothetical protein
MPSCPWAASLLAATVLTPWTAQERPERPQGPRLAAASAASAALSQSAAPAPLFASNEILSFRLETDFGAVFKERGQESKEYPAKLSYTAPDGAPATLDIQVRTRGNFRLRPNICGFPPIRLDFPKKQVENTLFAGQDKLKLTVHCQDRRANYEQNLLLEYLIYRVFNLLTDQSFRARLARFTYVDAAGKRDTLTRYAFFVENDERMAARLGGTLFEVPGVHDEATERDQITRIAVFEYFIGNTDWSVWGLHNIILVERSSDQVMLAVPYDFDWSGVISAPYAKPDYRLPIKTVRERLFRGYCRTPEELAPVFQEFNEKKEAIYELYRNQEGLDPKVRDDALKYYDEFYKVINDPRAVNREFIRSCRQAG